jgi:hypothetical protein
MAHELAGALQQVRGIRERCALKESHVDVRGEYVDVAERRIAQAGHRAAVMQQLPHLVSASAHRLKPLPREVAQCASMRIHPRIDGGIALPSTVESQQLRLHRRSVT